VILYRADNIGIRHRTTRHVGYGAVGLWVGNFTFSACAGWLCLKPCASLFIRMLPVIKTVGTKGSDVYSSTGDPRVDLSVKMVRKADADALRVGLSAVLDLGTQEATEDAAVMTFHSRNVRGGKGERDVFYALFQQLAAERPGLALDLMKLVPHYGCWRDVFHLACAVASLREKALEMAAAQLRADAATVEGSISLCAKWAPRERTSGRKEKDVSEATKARREKEWALAKDLAAQMFPGESKFSNQMRMYRKLVTGLNKRLDTVETHMCSKDWASIKPGGVPGRAGKIYSKAFLNLALRNKKEVEAVGRRRRGVGEDTVVLRHPDDEDRMACRDNFVKHFAAAKAGTAKVHGADTVFPHEVVKKAFGPYSGYASTTVGDSVGGHLTEDERNQLSAVWRSMIEKAMAGGGLGRSVFMSDFSGSMQCSSSGDTPYWVSMALGILGSQVCSDEFRGLMMTFDSTPKWHRFPTGADGVPADLFDCMKTLNSHIGQGTSTDFQAAMDLVLTTLKTMRVKPGSEPENLIVLTDMNWDQAAQFDERGAYTGNRYQTHAKTAAWETHLDMIKASFKRVGEELWGEGGGYVPPRIVIWNLAASPKTDYHAKSDTPGVALLSGWSPTQFAVLQKEGPRQMTVYEMLRIELDDTQYDRVRDIVRSMERAAGGAGAVAPKAWEDVKFTGAPMDIEDDHGWRSGCHNIDDDHGWRSGCHNIDDDYGWRSGCHNIDE
jgi:hypothetical protein